MSSPALPPHLDPRGRHRGGRSGGVHAIRPVGRVIGSILSITLLVVSGYAWYQFHALDKGVSRINVAVGSNPSGSSKDLDGKDQNILIVGNDDRSNMTDKEVKDLHVGRDGGSLATDTMMIVHVPADGSRATLISLPRDTFVKIPDGYRDNKLNSAYASAYVDKSGDANAKRTAGANLLIKTITNLTGLTINHYVQIDLLGFYRLAVAIKGVTVTLCNNVDDRHSSNVARGDDGGSGLYLSKGTHNLTPLQTLEFVRQRHNLQGGDLARVKRQQYFLTAAFRKVASVGIITRVQELGDALKRSVYFDGSLDLLDLARQLESLTANKIVGKTIPTYTDGNGNLTADPAKVQTFVANLITGPTATTSSTPKQTTSKSAATAPSSKASSSATAIDKKCIN